MPVQNLLGIVLLVAISGLLLKVGKAVLLPFVLAVFIWHIIDAVAQQLARLPVLRDLPLAAGLYRVLTLLLLFLLLWFPAETVFEGAGRLRQEVPGYLDNLRDLASRLLPALDLEQALDPGRLWGELEAGALLAGMFASLTSLLGSGGAVLLYVIFLLLEQHSFPARMRALFPDPEREREMRRLLGVIAGEVRAYLWLKTIVSMVTALLSYGVMKLLGLDFAGFWALLIFALNFIPYLGSLAGVALPSLLGLAQFGAIPPFLFLIGGLAAVQLLMGNVLEPRLLGKGLNLSPLAMLLALGVWGGIWGGAGMFLSVPLMVSLMIVFAHIPRTRPIAVLMSQDGRLRS
ncbi:MAG: AI-2E family transporter [Gammaproteobacteria bacterium]|nr:AI-2E family transporter [Gammaproteobacteria bacterium]MDD9863703.1 AI-2E family transporter [Gammaproteobacteria bacterium]